MEISMVREWLANWTPGIQVAVAAVIAFSSICTLVILRKQNRTKGWLNANGRRLWRLSYYETPRLSPNPPKGSGHREGGKDERSRVEAARP